MVQPSEEYIPPTINGTSLDVLQVDLYAEDALTKTSHELEFPHRQIGRGWIRVKDVQVKIGQIVGLAEADVGRVELRFGEARMGEDGDAKLRQFGVHSGSEIEAWTPRAIESVEAQGESTEQGS